MSMTAHTSETSRKTILSILPFWLLDLRAVCLPESRERDSEDDMFPAGWSMKMERRTVQRWPGHGDQSWKTDGK